MAAIFESSSRNPQLRFSMPSQGNGRDGAGPASNGGSLPNSNGPSNNDRDGEMEEQHGSKRVKLTNKLACSRCRSLKAKCEPQEPPNGKCFRCTRLSYDCLWIESQKRGRKVNNTRRSSSRGEVAAPMDSQPDTSQHDEPLHRLAISASAAAPLPSHPSTIMPPNPSMNADSVLDFAPNTSSQQQQQQQHHQQNYSVLSAGSSSRLPQSRPNPPQQQSPADPSPFSDAQRSYDRTDSLRDDTSPRSAMPSLSMMDLAQAKVKALQDLSAPGLIPALQRRPTTESRPEPDPIDMHVLSELDAMQLFDHYHLKMNAFIILLDPFLHKTDYVRRTSPVLFCTILAVSAKFIRPQLYPPLLMHARQLIGRAIIDGKVSIGLIQAMLIQVYWKEPDDSSAWLRVGEAIRMGYQMHLHNHRIEPLPDDEFEARLILDRERTWIDLCAFDQTFFLQSGEEDDGFHQTCMIPHFRMNVQNWLRETKHFGVQDDLEQGANFEWIKMQRLSKDILRARPGNARALGEHVQGTLEAAYQQYLDPTSNDAFGFETRPWIRVNFWLAAASLALTRAMLTAIGVESDLLAKWVVASGTFVDALEIIARHGYIQYWQDTLGITLYSMGEFSVKIFPKVYPATQRAIVGWMERIYNACKNCADGQTESTAAFISRFFQLCLRAVGSPTTTPESSTNLGNNNARIANIMHTTHNSQPSGNMLDPMQTPVIGIHDASYWESIFPGLSTNWSWLAQSLEEGMRSD